MLAITKFLVLPFLSLWAVFSIFYFSYHNGFIRQMQEVIALRKLPPTNQPLKTHFTGFSAVDEGLTAFIPFFYPIFDGSTPNLSLHAFNFSGAVAAIFGLVTIESLRNHGKDDKRSVLHVLLLPSVVGIICQGLTFGVIMPIYAILHLCTCPPNSTFGWVSHGRSIAQLKAVPLSIVVGHVLPCLLLALPETATGQHLSKQGIIAFWQPFPVWMSIVRFIASKVTAGFTTNTLDGKSRNQLALRSSLRYLYSFAFCCACIPHIISWTISIGALTFPMLFNAEMVSDLSPANVFFNTFPWSSARPESIGMGSLWFLQWDQLIGCLAVLVWSITLYRSAHLTHGVPVSLFSLTLKVIALCLVAGVAGAAVELMWEREELGFQVERERSGNAKKLV